MSDEPTNIIRRPKTPARPDASKRPSPGTIRFACSNGHQIVVPAKLAGKRGTCSRCGVPVLIPLTAGREAAGTRAEEPPAPEAAPEEPQMLAEPVAEEPPTVEAEAAEVGPTAAAEPSEVPDFSGFGAESGEAEPEPSAAEPTAFEGLDGAVGNTAAMAFEGVEGGGEPEIDGVDNPTAVLVAKLFGECEHGGLVELHLKSGQIVMPLLYDFNWSRGTHGVFAAENKSDNTITLMAVAWESVEQVIVRKVRGLPEGMFE